MAVIEIISSEDVRLFEGNANELVPKAKLSPDIHGFAIVVPAGEVQEWKLDLIWRIAILHAVEPRILKSRAKVTRIFKAVMWAASRPRSEFENTLAVKAMKFPPNALRKSTK
jgi:hypothetical protein